MADFFARLGERVSPELWMLLGPWVGLAAALFLVAAVSYSHDRIRREVRDLRERVAHLEGRADRQPDAR